MMGVSNRKWTVLETQGSFTLLEIIEIGQRSGVEPSDIEISGAYDGDLQVGYMRQKSEHEMAVELSNRKAAIREQNTEYKRLGLL